jgi:hypothetical protein
LIDDTVLYRRALSGAEVQAVMSCGSVLPPPGASVTAGPQDQTNFLGTIATFTPIYDGCTPGTYQWYFGISPIPSQTNGSLTIGSVQLANAGSYWVAVTNGSGGATSSVAVLTVINTHLPVARPDGIATISNTPVGLALAKLLANDSDSDGGDVLAVISVSATSTNGGTVTLTSTNVIYTPVGGFTGADRFTYTISDGHGGTATTFVDVLVVATGNLPSQNQVALFMTATTSIVRFAGVPGHSYSIERSTDLITWTPLAIRVAPAHGLIEYVDSSPPAGSAFYRTVGQ